MLKVVINGDKCKGCGLCIEVCPKKILRFSEKINAMGYTMVECTDQDLCILCKSCALVCPDLVFTLNDGKGGSE
ncbi:4Fe-4S dicluster domain-containing protein [Limisalsivibrio acetivorans]|uniref:4Fe-4S dicluster domain-containing protein n=1 Tax=Limisalsivibrio acetivorans TaxID=1304888 RepID=UPI0003B67A9D|nr:4Fe-4S binding protein [Limisalsivibrio acetivorans]